jgi:hypothetical protein
VEELGFLLLQLLIELFFQFFLEVLWEFGAAEYKGTYERRNHHIVVSALGYFVAGTALGALSLLFWPERFFEPGPIPGLSLVLSPVCVGGAMHAWGQWRRKKGHVTTNLATFAGGGVFAFGTALIRFLLAK